MPTFSTIPHLSLILLSVLQRMFQWIFQQATSVKWCYQPLFV